MPEISYIQKILERLVAEHIITPERFRELVNFKMLPHQSVYEFLESNNVKVGKEDVAEAMAAASKTPYFNLVGLEIEKDVINIIPQEVSRNYQVIAFKKQENVLYVGFVNPQNIKAVEAIDFLAKESEVQVTRYIISIDSFKYGFKQYRELESEVTEALTSAKQQLGLEKESESVDLDTAVGEAAKGASGETLKRAPVSKIVSVIIRHAVEGGASDVHIEPMANQTRVRYRIDGILYTSITLPRYVQSAIVARVKVMAKLKLDETRLPQDGRIRLVVDGKEVDFRISTLPLVIDEKVVMRILNVTTKAPTLEELGFLPHDNKILTKLIENPTGGMIIISGPTGSGKSTTLFSLLSSLNKEGVNIITIEDPVEYFVKGVNQAQVKPEIGFTFARGLRSFLRQDPDIIMLGEVRDEETAELSIHAGLTGHLVLTTLHTNNAAGTIPRLIDMGTESFFVASTISVVMAQRLARRICNDCKVKTDIPPKVRESFLSEFSKINKKTLKENAPNLKAPYTFKKGKGCSKCGGSGYKGRLALSESIYATNELKEIIVNGNDSKALEEELKRQNMISIREDGMIKVLLGYTTVDEVWRVTAHSNEKIGGPTQSQNLIQSSSIKENIEYTVKENQDGKV